MKEFFMEDVFLYIGRFTFVQQHTYIYIYIHRPWKIKDPQTCCLSHLSRLLIAFNKIFMMDDLCSILIEDVKSEKTTGRQKGWSR